jgi:2-(1,2-epoxy-1,2-dihydrophenyl)acetyl-CoA isomerase
MTERETAVTLTIDSGVARIVLNQPDTGNAIGVDFVNRLDEISLECSERDDVRAVVLSSTGPRFCVGGDIRGMTSERADITLPAYIRKCNAILQGALARLQHMAAPSIAVVQGIAAGGGLSLLAGCDIVVASDTAQFVAAYPSIGYCPDMGGSTMVCRRLGVARARRFYLLHEKLDAATAQQVGLADVVVAPGELIAAAEVIVQRWANGPTAAYAEIRRLMLSAATAPLEAQMELETQALAKLARSEDAMEALNAFLGKRPAVFRGR